MWLAEVDLSGNRVGVLFAVFHAVENRSSVNWLSGRMCIPFDRVEGVRVEGCSPVNFAINVSALGNLEAFRIAPWDAQSIEGFLRLLHPDPRAGVPCLSLREIEGV